MQCIRKMKQATSCRSIFMLITYLLPKLIYSRLTLLKRKLASPFKNQLTWPLRSKLAPKRQPLSTKLCAFNRKLMVCSKDLRSKQRSRMKRLTRTSGNLRLRMKESDQQVWQLPMPEQRRRRIWSRLRQRLIKLSSKLTHRGSGNRQSLNSSKCSMMMK